MADVVSETNTKIMSYFSNFDFLNILGWILFAVILSGAVVWFYFYYKNKKMFNKTINVFEIIGGMFSFSFKDKAKVIKIGSGGFEILYLQKLKTWKIAYGGRIGKSLYYFFIMPDGYWYNGTLSANVYEITKLNGLIPVVTTNASMRAQYTSLEKQIDSLHKGKQDWWEKYGSWVLSIAFVLIAGVMLWLMFKEFTTAMASFKGVAEEFKNVAIELKGIAGTGKLTGGNLIIP